MIFLLFYSGFIVRNHYQGRLMPFDLKYLKSTCFRICFVRVFLLKHLMKFFNFCLIIFLRLPLMSSLFYLLLIYKLYKTKFNNLIIRNLRTIYVIIKIDIIIKIIFFENKMKLDAIL